MQADPTDLREHQVPLRWRVSAIAIGALAFAGVAGVAGGARPSVVAAVFGAVVMLCATARWPD